MEKKMIDYLQAKMDEFNKLAKVFGMEDERVDSQLDQLIGAKELVEAMIGQPVNLQKDGKVTIGF